MRYEYRRQASATKLFNAKELTGLPADIDLRFSNVHVRIYESQEQKGYFSASLAIPSHKDDEGYVLELYFNDPIESKMIDNPILDDVPSFESDFDFGEPSTFEYEAPLNDHDVDTITEAISCKFSDKTERGKRLLILNAAIKGTPFSGYVLIDRELYERQA